MIRIAIIAILCIAPLALAQAIVKDGKSDYVIVLAEKPLSANRRAAAEFNSHLKQMTGVELSVQADSKPLPNRAILIGPSAHVDALGVKLDKSKLGNDGFVLKTVGDRLVIAGPGPRGSMYGVSDVLEKLGVRWFTPRVTLAPKKASIELPALDETQVPAFEYREPFFTEARDRDFAARNRIVGNSPNLDESTGGTIRYTHFVHTFDAFVPPALFDKHPEYFPLVNGKRINGYVQRCLTNPDVLNLTIDAVKKSFRDNPTAIICSVSQNDVDKWCTCDECNSIVNAHGGVQSAIYLWFANKVAEAIEPEFPDKLIDTLAYQFTEKPPTGIVPRKNVRVRLCPIFCCESHVYETDDHPASKAFVANLSAWARISDTLYIWHYNTNFGHYLSPFPDFGQFPASIRMYQRSGVKGIFFQGDYSPGGGGSDAELRSWVMAKLLWNPKADSDKLVTEWMQGVYGPAWQPMRKWFDLLHSQFAIPQNHLGIYDGPRIDIFTKDVLEQGEKWFDEARSLAQSDLQREYIAKNRLGLRYVQLLHYPRADQVFEQFLADMQHLGITHISEGQTVKAWKKKYLNQPALKKE